MEDMYTLEGLKRAQEDLKRWEKKWANSDSNNPNKCRGNINEARSRARLIESVLKTNGTLPLTEQEQLNKDLDVKFPNSRSKDVVEFEWEFWGQTPNSFLVLSQSKMAAQIPCLFPRSRQLNSVSVPRTPRTPQHYLIVIFSTSH